MKIFLIIANVFFINAALMAQENVQIKKGNEAYKKGDYKAASEYYNKALQKDSKNGKAQFNLGNALLKLNEPDLSEKAYDAASTAEADLQSKAAYNKGLAFVKQKNLPDAINAFKQSLRLSPEDDDARENLQLALNELNKQQPQNEPDQKKKPSKEQQKHPPPKQNNLTQQRADQLLNQLRDQEKQLQKKLQKQKSYSGQQEKDW